MKYIFIFIIILIPSKELFSQIQGNYSIGGKVGVSNYVFEEKWTIASDFYDYKNRTFIGLDFNYNNSIWEEKRLFYNLSLGFKKHGVEVREYKEGIIIVPQPQVGDRYENWQKLDIYSIQFTGGIEYSIGGIIYIGAQLQVSNQLRTIQKSRDIILHDIGLDEIEMSEEMITIDNQRIKPLLLYSGIYVKHFVSERFSVSLVANRGLRSIFKLETNNYIVPSEYYLGINFSL